MSLVARSARDVFCNCPFDQAYEPLFLALISALLCTGQMPRTVLEVPAAKDRLERVLGLLEECPFSLHDLSRVQLSTGDVRVPRFNMPFELGLAVALARRGGRPHQFQILEGQSYRLQRTLSDLNGYDPYVHGNSVRGMFEAVCNAFHAARPYPIPEEATFLKVYRKVRQVRHTTFRHRDCYTPRAFAALVVAGQDAVRQLAR